MLGRLGIAGVCGGAAWLGYNCYAPTSQLYGSTLAWSSDSGRIALTYDDGPNDVHTERLLDVLARHEVKATFFLIGRFVGARPQIARAIVDGGHLLGNHTYSHPNLLFLSRSGIADEISGCSKAIADVTGVSVRYFRPPFGARRPGVLRAARNLGLQPVMWDVTCFDWKRTWADRVERHATRRIDRDRFRGHIVLLHDGGHARMGHDRRHSVEATERLLLRYKNEYRFLRVDEM